MRNTVVRIGLTDHHVLSYVRDAIDNCVIGIFTRRSHDGGYSIILTNDMSSEHYDLIPDRKFIVMSSTTKSRVIDWMIRNASISEVTDITILTGDGSIVNIETGPPVVAEPEFPPYKPGTLVFDVKTKSNNLCTNLFPQDLLGKVLSYETGNKTYKYTIQFMDQGTRIRSHEYLLPVENFFDKYDTAAYTSIEDCNNLFLSGERFLLRDNYLYNRDQTVILSYNKFKNLFKQIVNATVQTSDTNA